MSNWKKMPVHPFAAMFPRPTEMEHVALVQDMKERGYDKHQPIITADGQILDGISRRDAAIEAGVEPVFREHKSNDLLGFVVSVNIHRRHLTTSQRQIIAADIATVLKDSSLQNLQSGSVYTAPARALNVSERGVAEAATIIRDAEPETVEAVRNGTISTNDAKHIKDEKPAVQRAAVKDVQAGKANTATEAAAKRSPASSVADKAAQRIARQNKKENPDADMPTPDPKVAPMDQLGNPVPKSLRDTFAGNTESLSNCVKLLQEVKRTVKGLQAWNAYMRPGEMETKLAELIEDFKNGMPYVVCQPCKGKGCTVCRNEGWMPKWREAEVSK